LPPAGRRWRRVSTCANEVDFCTASLSCSSVQDLRRIARHGTCGNVVPRSNQQCGCRLTNDLSAFVRYSPEVGPVGAVGHRRPFGGDPRSLWETAAVCGFHGTGGIHRPALDVPSTQKLRATVDGPNPVEALLHGHGQPRAGPSACLFEICSATFPQVTTFVLDRQDGAGVGFRYITPTPRSRRSVRARILATV